MPSILAGSNAGRLNSISVRYTGLRVGAHSERKRAQGIIAAKEFKSEDSPDKDRSGRGKFRLDIRSH